MTSYKEKLNPVTTFIFDVDGVLTDGSVIMYKDEVVRTLNSRDGNSEAIEKRLETLGVTEVCMRAHNKVDVYDTLKEKYGFEDEEVLYMGDDIPDYQVLQIVGVSTCPQDAAVELKTICDYQSPYNGGRHCVRDVIEQTMRVQGKWFSEKAFEW